MKVRSLLVGAAALVGVALMPGQASAQTPACTFNVVQNLGLGGSLSGCFVATVTALGEDASQVTSFSFFNGFPGSSGANNTPTGGTGQSLFNDDCGSAGNGIFSFCTGPNAKPVQTINVVNNEAVFGGNAPDNDYFTGSFWEYSGAAARNLIPGPAGFQEVLYQLTDAGGNLIPNQYLVAWEDLNSACQTATPNATTFRQADLTNATVLDTKFGDCTSFYTGGTPDSDNDFNDFYFQVTIQQGGVPLNITPEPMTMSLMAMGLVGLGGASLRRRNKK